MGKQMHIILHHAVKTHTGLITQGSFSTKGAVLKAMVQYSCRECTHLVAPAG